MYSKTNCKGRVKIRLMTNKSKSKTLERNIETVRRSMSLSGRRNYILCKSNVPFREQKEKIYGDYGSHF